MGSWSNTATGLIAIIESPHRAAICIEDIALSLSKLCRFGGHIRRDIEHFSVAQHSVLVSVLCEPRHALLGLLHDAAESYVGDVTSPVKRCIGAGYAVIEKRWAYAIGDKFGLDLVNLPDDVKRADLVALATERRDLCEHKDRDWGLPYPPAVEVIRPLRAMDAHDLFMARWKELTT